MLRRAALSRCVRACIFFSKNALAGLKTVQVQFPALLDHMTELLAATRAGLHKRILPLAAKIRSAEGAVQLQGKFFKLKARAFMRRALNHDFKAELQRLWHNTGKGPVSDVHSLDTCAALPGDFLFRHFQQTLCNCHFVHDDTVTQTPGKVKAVGQSCHSA